MSIENEADKDADNSENRPKDTPSGLRWVLVGGGIVWLVLLAVAVWHPGITTRVKFFTDSTLNLFIVLAVVAQVLVYRKQWDVMERQARIADQQREIMQSQIESAEVTDRAYVGIANVVLTVSSDQPTVIVTWVNGGRTPALHFRAMPVLIWNDKPGTNVLRFIDDDYDTGVRGTFLPAGATLEVPYKQDLKITDEVIKSLLNGSKQLFIGGSGVYVDAR